MRYKNKRSSVGKIRQNLLTKEKNSNRMSKSKMTKKRNSMRMEL
ncbi:hypothetical protein BLAHAN_04423 [Blautia hansenii DSM 20583]|uniref:Uncharacterized protein n=1 Tax=Blautia hansenii DSM 20583 TaxID=537007 RepID=C9L4X3_BLAHA|nr:hypothetical protein BLAHAN_04423 [Blautia hansenii DSM 20583]